MSLDNAAMTTLVTTKLQSAGTMDYLVAEVNSAITEGLKEFAHYQPHIVPLTLQIESRYGTAETTTADKLLDATKGQFLTTDVTNEKVVYNTHDRKWAVISGVTSTAEVSVSRDIFAINENYRIYNQRCWNRNQLYIGGMPDYVEIDSVEYPIGQKRNFEILNDVLEIDVDSVADSDASSSKTQLPDVDVLIRFNRPHILTPLTDLAGKLAATAAEGATTISGSSLQAAGTLNIGDEFYIGGQRTLYTVTTAATIAVTAAIAFYPPLESALASTATTFTFTKSSLSAQQEDIFADLVSARLAISKPVKMYSQANSAIATIASATTAIAAMTISINAATTAIAAMTVSADAATTAIAAGTTELAKTVALIASAGTAIALVNAQVDLASTAIAAGTALINTLTVDDTPQTDWLNSASGYLSVAGGFLSEANGYFTQAQSDASIFTRYRDLAVVDLNVANQYINKAVADLRISNQYMGQAATDLKQVSSQLSISNAGKALETWGQNKLAETLSRLRRTTKPKKSVRFPTE